MFAESALAAAALAVTAGTISINVVRPLASQQTGLLLGGGGLLTAIALTLLHDRVTRHPATVSNTTLMRRSSICE
jgi:uncharacterized membrane protein